MSENLTRHSSKISDDAKRAVPARRTILDTGSGPTFTYTNDRAELVQLLVTGGEVSRIDILHEGIYDSTSMTGGMFPLGPGLGVTIYFSVAPTVVLYEGRVQTALASPTAGLSFEPGQQPGRLVRH